MNLSIKRCLSGLMTWAALTGIAIAQQPGETEGTVKLGGQAPAVQSQPLDTEGMVRMGNPSGGVPEPVPLIDGSSSGMPNGYFGTTPVDNTFRPRFNIDSRGGGLYGYEAGYSTIGAFIPFATDGDEALVFLDVRGLMTYDNGGGGANVGLGWRRWIRDFDSIVGASIWYDNSNGAIGSNFNQIGLSFEYLSRYLEYRVNGYIPAGEHDHYGDSVLNSTAACMGNNIVFQRTTQVAQAYTGFDIETGGPLPIIGRYGFNGYVGGYHFMGAGQNGGSFTGVSGRFLTQINEDVSFGMQVTSDRSFGLNTQFQVFVTLPDGVPGRWMRNPSVQDRLTQSVFRQFRAITKVDALSTFDTAINPETGNPYFVAFIDPNQTVAGTGTDANPFMSIAQYNSLTVAQKDKYDVIVVNGRGDGSSTNLDTGLGTAAPALGLRLLDDQRLWGANAVHDFTTPTGTFQFLCNANAATPILVNEQATQGNVITLADGNEVSGFTINGATPLGTQNYGIRSQAGGITGGFNINQNNFTNTLVGVQLTHSGSALGQLTSNTVAGGPATGSSIGFQSNGGFEVTQTAGALDLLVRDNTITNVKGEDANGNGVLDIGEDTNGNAVLDLGIGMHFAANGVGAVINANDPTSTTQPLGILDNDVSDSGAGILLESLAGARFNASVESNTLSNNTTGSTALPTDGFGFAATANGAGSVMWIETYTNNETNSNEGDGAVLTASAGGILRVVGDIVGPVSGSTEPGNTFNDNRGDGLRIQADAGSIVVEAITGTEFTGNTENGLHLLTTNLGLITINDPLAGNTFTDNGLNGLLADSQSGRINFTINSTTSPNVFDDNTGDGLRFQVATGGLINTDLSGLTANNNGGDGIALLLDGGRINVTNIQANTATGNGQDGMSITNSNGGVFDTNAIGGLTAALGNDFSNNTRAGLFFGGVEPPTPLSLNNINLIANNNFNRTTSGTVGVLFDTTNVLTSAGGGTMISLIQNSFVGGANTSSMGLGGDVNGGGVRLAFGDNKTTNANIFTSNRDANIGLVMTGDSINRVTIDSHDLSGVINGANTTFNGEGVALILRETARLTGYIQRSSITNNADDGIRIDVAGTSLPTEFAAINNFVIGGVTENLGNLIQGNGANGLEVHRVTNGHVTNMQILNNTFQNNTLNGMRLVASNEPNQDTYTINQNLIATNGLDGIQMRVEADASINSTIDQNMITGNGTLGDTLFGSGIHTLEQANTATDGRFIAGLWTRNIITDNNLDGIDLDASMTTLVIGDTVDTNLGNLVSGNNRNGINVEGPGEVIIGSNLIQENGTAGTLGTAAETAAIKANVRPTSDLTIINNQIVNNFGDGIEYSIAQGLNGWFSQVQIVGNYIAFNDGRGIDILNRQSNFIQVSITDNIINRNDLEGVYVVNTSSSAQNQFDSSTTAMDQNGNPFQNPVIEMQFVNNQVIGNGFGTTFQPGGPASGTGLVVRVGTSGASNSTIDPGGFASIGSVIPVGGTPFGESTGRGGVTLVVDENAFSGNFGDDVLFQSFVSTQPTATGTAWDNTQFNSNGYVTDPLSRLDLHFHNNTFDTADFNNTAGVSTGNNNFVAFYNNADGVFKSRSSGIQGPNIAGPFNNTARRRNAQRQAARYNLPPNVPPGLQYLYPGMGDSTFRVSSDSDLTGFLLDFSSPMVDENDANGVFLPGNNPFGEQPFGWGTY